MDLSAYPNLSFKLDDGRKIKVHVFIWEPSYPETLLVGSGKDRKEVEIERKRLQSEKIIGPRKTHVVNMEYIDKFQNHPPRIPNSAINVLLSSGPITEGALYSELVVLVFMDYVEGSSMESILEEKLHDLDWEEHAEDVSDHTNELWKEAWLVRTVH